jgi:polar amino acid transport system ATP-binding protein
MQTLNDEIIHLKGLNKFFGKTQILKDVNLNVNKGQLVSIIGRSGCGKTTLLRCMNCLEILNSGTMHIAGITLSRRDEKNNNKEISKRLYRRNPFRSIADETRFDEDFIIKTKTLRQRVGMVFQSFNLFPNLTVLENLTIAPIIVKKESERAATVRAVELLEKVDMGEYVKRYPHQLSGGQAQRVAIARALAMSPQVMLYDEPTSALDPELVEEVLRVMINLHKEGMTQVVVTHKVSFAKNASDLVVFMEAGQIIEADTPKKIFLTPEDKKTKQFISIFKD